MSDSYYSQKCVLEKISTPNASIFFLQISLFVAQLWSNSATRFDVSLRSVITAYFPLLFLLTEKKWKDEIS